MIHQHEKVERLWRETAAKLAQADPEDREEIREGYVRDAVRVLESPDGGYFVKDLSEITSPADRFEAQCIKRAFKRLHKRGELEKVAPVGDGMVFRLS